MAWHYTQLSEAAEYAMNGISECLNVDFAWTRQSDDEDNLIFTFSQTGSKLIGIAPQLIFPAADIAKAFYQGKPQGD